MSSAVESDPGTSSEVTPAVGVAAAATLPARWYADPEHHRNEMDTVFGRGWSCVGVVDDVEPGGYLATVAGQVPVVVTRSADGRLRAFLNACRHRGAPVAEGCGPSRLLTCPYHAWSYRLDGTLATFAGMDGAAGFEPEEFGLLPVGVATWSRFLFVCPLEDPPPFDLGPLASAIDPYPTDLHLVRRKSVERTFNWKLLVENYSENFHTPFVHPQLTWQRWEYPIIGDGAIALAWDRPLLPSNPVEEALAWATPTDPEWAGVAVDQIDDVFLSGAYFTVFPNLLVSAFPRYVSAFWLTPTAVDRTVVSYVRFWADEVDEQRREADLVASEDVAAQDLDICEAMQRTFSGGADPRGRLSPEHETGVFHVHQLVRAALGGTAVALPAVRGRTVSRESLEARRAEILQTTINVIVERGFGAMRISDVARQLGISTGLVHYHFESKDQLVAEAVRYAADDERTSMEDEVEATDGVVEKLDTVFQAYCPKEAEPGWLLWIDSWGESLRSPDLRRISQELDVAFANLLVSIIESGVAEGTFTTDDARASAWRLSSMIDGLAVQLTVHDGIVDGITMLDWVRQGAANELRFDVKLFTRRRRRRAA